MTAVSIKKSTFASKSHFNGFLVDLGAQGFSQVLLNASREGLLSPKGFLNKVQNLLKRIQHRSRNRCLPGNRILIDVGWIWEPKILPCFAQCPQEGGKLEKQKQ